MAEGKEFSGYQIREAIRRWILRRDLASNGFKDSLWAFEGDEKETPHAVGDTYDKADHAIAALECLQQQFNIQVTVRVMEDTWPLAMAVKRVGGAGRMEKLWRMAATDTGREKYDRYDNIRKEGEIRAKKQISKEEAAKKADESARFAGALRAAIAMGNAQKMTVTDQALIEFLEK